MWSALTRSVTETLSLTRMVTETLSLRIPVDSSSWESVLEEGRRLEKAFMENPERRRMIYNQWLAVKHLLLIMAANNPERKEAMNEIKETFLLSLPLEESLLDA